jgi:hypothetical protein
VNNREICEVRYPFSGAGADGRGDDPFKANQQSFRKRPA